MSMRSEVRTVTPEWATKILEEHDKRIMAGTFAQRPLSDARVKRYEMEMKLGNWGENGESIVFDEDGNLLQGQHRLHAIARTRIPVKMVTVWDVAAKVNSRVRMIDTFDSGMNRTPGGQLKIEGYEYFGHYASCSRLLAVMCFNRGRNPKECKPSTSQIVTISSLIRPTFDPMIHKIGAKNVRMIKSALTAPVVLLRAVDPDTADLFVNDYTEMLNLKKGSPIIALKKFFERPIGSAESGTRIQAKGFVATASALWYYTNEKPIENIRGNDEHTDWIFETSKNLVKKIREAVGADLTIAGLEGKG